jgi:hypothetical protein
MLPAHGLMVVRVDGRGSDAAAGERAVSAF